MAVFINIRYTDGTGAITQCEAKTCAQAVDALKAYFQLHAEKARSENGACVERIAAVNIIDITDTYEIAF